jgi:hypothetical protein
MSNLEDFRRNDRVKRQRRDETCPCLTGSSVVRNHREMEAVAYRHRVQGLKHHLEQREGVQRQRPGPVLEMRDMSQLSMERMLRGIWLGRKSRMRARYI